MPTSPTCTVSAQCYDVPRKLPWEKKSDTHVTVGALFVYKIEDETNWNMTRIWVKSFPS